MQAECIPSAHSALKAKVPTLDTCSEECGGGGEGSIFLN